MSINLSTVSLVPEQECLQFSVSHSNIAKKTSDDNYIAHSDRPSFEQGAEGSHSLSSLFANSHAILTVNHKAAIPQIPQMSFKNNEITFGDIIIQLPVSHSYDPVINQNAKIVSKNDPTKHPSVTTIREHLGLLGLNKLAGLSVSNLVAYAQCVKNTLGDLQKQKSITLLDVHKAFITIYRSAKQRLDVGLETQIYQPSSDNLNQLIQTFVTLLGNKGYSVFEYPIRQSIGSNGKGSEDFLYMLKQSDRLAQELLMSEEFEDPEHSYWVWKDQLYQESTKAVYEHDLRRVQATAIRIKGVQRPDPASFIPETMYANEIPVQRFVEDMWTHINNAWLSGLSSFGRDALLLSNSASDMVTEEIQRHAKPVFDHWIAEIENSLTSAQNLELDENGIIVGPGDVVYHLENLQKSMTYMQVHPAYPGMSFSPASEDTCIQIRGVYKKLCRKQIDLLESVIDDCDQKIQAEDFTTPNRAEQKELYLNIIKIVPLAIQANNKLIDHYSQYLTKQEANHLRDKQRQCAIKQINSVLHLANLLLKQDTTQRLMPLNEADIDQLIDNSVNIAIAAGAEKHLVDYMNTPSSAIGHYVSRRLKSRMLDNSKTLNTTSTQDLPREFKQAVLTYKGAQALSEAGWEHGTEVSSQVKEHIDQNATRYGTWVTTQAQDISKVAQENDQNFKAEDALAYQNNPEVLNALNVLSSLLSSARDVNDILPENSAFSQHLKQTESLSAQALETIFNYATRCQLTFNENASYQAFLNYQRSLSISAYYADGFNAMEEFQQRFPEYSGPALSIPVKDEF